MENLAHTLCGLALARVGGDRLSPLATPVLVIAANLPDLDVLGYPFGGRPYYLCHHRGLTHALLGIAVESLLLAAAAYGIGRRLRGPERDPLRFWGLWLAALVGLLSHLLLDSLNTYGVRPFLPFASTRYFGDLAFIIDPWLWLCFGSAACLGAPRPERAASGSERRRESAARLGWWTLLVVGSGLLLSREGSVRVAGLVFAPALLGVIAIRHTLWLRALRQQMAWAGLGAAVVYLAALGTLQARADARARAALEAIGVEVRLSTTHPGFALPWRFRSVLASETQLYELDLDLLDDSPPRVRPGLLRRLDHPALPGVADTPEYAAWRSFARIPFVAELEPEPAPPEDPEGPVVRAAGTAPVAPPPAGTEGLPRRLVLGDARYEARARGTWCNLVVTPPPLDPTR